MKPLVVAGFWVVVTACISAAAAPGNEILPDGQDVGTRRGDRDAERGPDRLAAQPSDRDDPPPDSRAEGEAVPDGTASADALPAAAPATRVPKLVHFVKAEYPPQAQRQGLEAEVVLELTVDTDGRVTEVRVVGAAGNGFDEAALRAAHAFRFTPATRDGRPVAARIHYRYRFQLESKVTPAKPPQATPPDGELGGRVLVRGTSTAVAGARILVRRPDGTEVLVRTDEAGEWRLTNVPPGDYHVRVESPGYEPAASTVEVTPAERTEVTDQLDFASDVDGGAGLEVTVHGQRPTREVTRHTLSRRELLTIPGIRGDPLRAVENMPGVAVLALGDGDIVVRGTEPDSTLVFIDGLPVLRPYHCLGISSTFPAEILSKLDFYPGNYSVRYGRGLGGVIDMETRRVDTSGEYHGLVQADLIDARALVEGPVPGARDWYFLGAFRRSVVEWTLEPAFEWGIKPTYYDYQAFVETYPTRQSHLRVGVIGAHDRTKVYDGLAYERDERTHEFGYLATTYEVVLGEGLRWHHVLALGFQRTRAVELAGDYREDVRVPAYPFIGRAELELAPLPWAELAIGADIIYAPFSAELDVPAEEETRGPPREYSAARPNARVEAHDVQLRPAGYAELSLTPGARARIVAGLRADYAEDTAEWDFSPRLSARYDLVQQPQRTTLKGGVGLVHEPPKQQDVLEGLGNPDLESARAVHTSVGFEQELFGRLELSVEGYAHFLDRLIVAEGTENGRVELQNSGDGRTVGIETLIRYDTDEQLYGWVAYTLSRSTRRTGPGEPEYLLDEDQTHLLSALASYRFGDGWEAGAKFKYVSGRVYTPAVGSIYSTLAQEYVPIAGEINSRRLPDHHHLDLRLQKSWKLRHWVATAYVDVINAYAHRRVVGVDYNDTFTRSTYEYDVMATIPSAGFRGEF